MNKKPMRILIYIPVYKRREITKLCYDSLKRTILNSPDGFRFVVVTVVSNQQDATLAYKAGFDPFWCDNRPLGRKFNRGLEYALETYNWDYLMQINSDDVLSIDFWQLFEDFFDKKMFFFGIDKLYFYDSETKDMREFQYTTGCGIRFIRRDIVEKAGFIQKKKEEVFELWEPGLNSGLDMNSSNNIMLRTGKMQYIATNKKLKRPVVCDIKSQLNIHPFAEFKGAKRLSPAHRLQVMKRFPELKIYDERLKEQKKHYADIT